MRPVTGLRACAAALMLICPATVARADSGYAVIDLSASEQLNIFPIGGIGGGQVVGTGSQLGDGQSDHPLLWTGPARTLVDLLPARYGVGDAYKTDGNHQVGIALGGGTYDAFLWSGTPGSAIKLTPTGYNDAYAAAFWAIRRSGGLPSTKTGLTTP